MLTYFPVFFHFLEKECRFEYKKKLRDILYEYNKIKIVKLKYDVRQLFDKSQDRVCLLLE